VHWNLIRVILPVAESWSCMTEACSVESERKCCYACRSCSHLCLNQWLYIICFFLQRDFSARSLLRSRLNVSISPCGLGLGAGGRRREVRRCCASGSRAVWCRAGWNQKEVAMWSEEGQNKCSFLDSSFRSVPVSIFTCCVCVHLCTQLLSVV